MNDTRNVGVVTTGDTLGSAVEATLDTIGDTGAPVKGGRRVLVPCRPPVATEMLMVRSEGVLLTFPDGEVVRLMTYRGATGERVYLFAESNGAEAPEWYDITDEPDWGLYFSFVTGATDLDVVAEDIPVSEGEGPVLAPMHLGREALEPETEFRQTFEQAPEVEESNNPDRGGFASDGLKLGAGAAAAVLLPTAMMILPVLCYSLLLHVPVVDKDVAGSFFLVAYLCNLVMLSYGVIKLLVRRKDEWSTSDVYEFFFRSVVESTFGPIFVYLATVKLMQRLREKRSRRKDGQ